jgi:hypothetical protein
MALFLLICAGPAVFATGEGPEQPLVRSASCQGVDLEDGYVVRSSHVKDPFNFLPWVAAREHRVAAEISALVDKQAFRYDHAVNRALDIIRDQDFLPDVNGPRIRIQLYVVSVENCSKPNVDVSYGVYSTQIAPTLNGAPKALQVERLSPQSTAGLAGSDLADMPLHFVPIAAYDSTDKLSGGARLEIGAGRIRNMPFGSLVVEGQSSGEMMSVSAALAGSVDRANWLSHLEWRLNYSTYKLPTGTGDLRKASLAGLLSGGTRAFGNGRFAGRFGTLVEGGNQHSSTTGLSTPADTIPASGFGGVKVYGGLDSRMAHQVLSASYGLELGAIDPGAGVGWRKHIGDVRHEFWYPLQDHRILELESRLTTGALQVPGRIPLAERFFGGNHEEFIIPDDSWQIRANPVIRAIPGSRFYGSAVGTGADWFASYNLTAAYTVWRTPLVPSELTKDAQFHTLLNGQITTATSAEQILYATRDPHYRNLVDTLEPLKTDLADLKAEVEAAQSAHPGQLAAQFKACVSAINMAASRAKSASAAKDFQQYGLVSALLSVDVHEDRLGRVTRACNQDLDGALGIEPAGASPEGRVDARRRKMEKEFAQIDRVGAANRAKAEMSYVGRTLNTLLREVNLYSISPVAILDVVKIGPAAAGGNLLRYGPGGGIRLALASVLSLTVGYARNIRKGPGEGSGNVFLSLTVRDLFH